MGARISEILALFRSTVLAFPLSSEHVQMAGDALHLSVVPFARGVESEADLGAHLAVDVWRAGSLKDPNRRGNVTEGLGQISTLDFVLSYSIRDGQEREDYDRALDLCDRLTAQLQALDLDSLFDAQIIDVPQISEVNRYPGEAPYLILVSTFSVSHTTGVS